MQERFNFNFGDTVWFAYIEPIHTINKHGIRVMNDKGKDVRFSLPMPSVYLSDLDNGRGKKLMVLKGAVTQTKKVTGDSFRSALKLLVHKLDKKDKKNGNSILITRLTNMFPQSPYYNEHPEWFV